MGFVTESQMRTDYTSLFHKQIGDTQYNLQGWLTPNGILIEVIKETIIDKLSHLQILNNNYFRTLVNFFYY